MKKKKIILLIVISVLCFQVVCGVGYFKGNTVDRYYRYKVLPDTVKWK